MSLNVKKWVIPLISIVVGTFVTYADLIAIDNVVYNYYPSSGTAEVCKFTGSETNVSLPESISISDMNYQVTCIGDSAFFGCDYLTHIKIPNSIITIESSAFAECNGLNSIDLPDSLDEIGDYAFEKCSKLKVLTIPNSVKRIGDYAFRECTNLISVIIGNSVTSIGRQAFIDCKGLIKSAYPNTIGNPFYNGFTESYNPEGIIIDDDCIWGSDKSSIIFVSPNIEGEFIIPDSVSLIDARSFSNCNRLNSVKIPNSVTCISFEAFQGCVGLTSVTIPSSVTSIICGAFNGCNNLESVFFNAENCEECGYSYWTAFPNNIKELIIGNLVKIIPPYAFHGCNKLKTIAIPNSVSSIGEGAFSDCLSLDSVKISSLDSWLNIDFMSETSNPTYYAKNIYIGEDILHKLIIPEGITHINPYSFINCDELVSVKLPTSLKSTGDSVFSGCNSLQRIIFPDENTFFQMEYSNHHCCLNYNNDAKYYIGNEIFNPEEIIIPNNISSIHDYTFYEWPDIKRIIINDNVKSIGNYAFSGCRNLATVIINSPLTSIGRGAFFRCESLNCVNINSLKSWLDIEFNDCYANPTYYAKRLVVDGEADNKLIIPDGTTYIKQFAFINCDWMTTIFIPSSITSIGIQAFYGCTELRAIRIKDVNKWARIRFGDFLANPLFYARNIYIEDNTSPIKNLVIDGNTSISNYAFNNAVCLERLHIKDGADIEENSFYGCYYLTDLCINCEQLPENGFNSCTNIRNIYIPLKTPPVAFNNTFCNYENVNLYVPTGSVSDYENTKACWYRFLDIYETDFEDMETIFAPDYYYGDAKIKWIDNRTDNQCPIQMNTDIYNLQGICLIHNATKADIASLSPGIYLINGSRVIVIK